MIAFGLLSLVYVLDLALFVLVFLVIRSRRIGAERMAVVIALAAGLYLASLGLLIFISFHL